MTSIQPLARGVYTAPYLLLGHRVVFAVDSAGRQRVLLPVLDDDETNAVHLAWNVLNAVDPAATLRVV